MRKATLLSAIALLLAGCGSGASSTTGSVSTPAAASVAVSATPSATALRVDGQVTVFSAASLTDTFKQMGDAIEKANPGTKITLNFAGSPTLRTQLAQG